MKDARPILTLAFIYASIFMHKYPEIKDVPSYCRFTNHFSFTMDAKNPIDGIRKAGFISMKCRDSAWAFRRSL